MKCFNPFLTHDKLGFIVAVPCGRCLACQSNRRQQWFTRLKFECENYINNCCFITLTYDDDHIPSDCMLHYSDVQLFWKRLRKELKKPIKYFCCGEYGEHTFRPHYHAIVFGVDSLALSSVLNEKWDKGFVSLAPVNDARLKYTVKYILKQDDFKRSFPNYVKPFIRCSQGLGLSTYLKHEQRYFDLDAFKVDGHYSSFPRYFKNKSTVFHGHKQPYDEMMSEYDDCYDLYSQRLLNFKKKIEKFSKNGVL